MRVALCADRAPACGSPPQRRPRNGPSRAAEGVAMLAQGRFRGLKARSDRHEDVPDPEDPDAAGDWTWRFVAAIWNWVMTDSTVLLEAVRSNQLLTRGRRQRAACSWRALWHAWNATTIRSPSTALTHGSGRGHRLPNGLGRPRMGAGAKRAPGEPAARSSYSEMMLQSSSKSRGRGATPGSYAARPSLWATRRSSHPEATAATHGTTPTTVTTSP